MTTKFDTLSDKEQMFDSSPAAKTKLQISSTKEANDLIRNLIPARESTTFFDEENDDIDGESLATRLTEVQSSSEGELFGLSDGSSWREKLKVLVSQSIPVVISFFLSVGGTFINLVFAGQYVHETGDKSAVFAGISLANMFANVSCLSILIGMSGAVETLGSQHNGAGNYKEVGFVLQRSYIILGIITLPIGILWFFASDIFASLGVEPVVCSVIQRFIRIRCLTIPMDVINESYEKYLMSIGVMQPSMWSNISFNIFILFFDLVFVLGFRLHYDCLAWSWVISLYLSAFLQIYLSRNYVEVRRTLQPWDRRALSDWKEFILLGLPGTVMLCSEWWAYEILTIFASLLGTAQVAAQTIILQTASLAFMIPLGFGVACASLVGNSLGAGKRFLAISLGRMSIYTVLSVQVVTATVLFIGGPTFVDLFSNDNEVKSVANRAIPFLTIFTIMDALQGVCSGVLRGAGKQFIGAVANVVAFYAIGLPMAWYLCFTVDFGVNGLMLGIAFGTLFQVSVLMTLIFVFESYIFSTNISHIPISTIKSFDGIALNALEMSVTDNEEDSSLPVGFSNADRKDINSRSRGQYSSVSAVEHD